MTVEIAELKILVIEDNDFVRRLIKITLEQLGCFNIAEVDNGAFALAIMEEADPPFDLILCDLFMPEMDGFEFIGRLRRSERPQWNEIPVIVLTGHTEKTTLLETIDLGIHGFAGKPVTSKALEKQIKRAMISPPLSHLQET